jgi:hypothetical protein
MARQETVKRFEVWKQDPENIEAFFGLMERGEAPLRFRDACMQIKVPYTLMHAHVRSQEALHERYLAILAAKADNLAHERLEIADNVKADRDAVAKAKLQCDVRDGLAAKWNKELYGETLRVEKTVSVGVDIGLRGRASELLARIAGRAPVLIEGEATAVRPDALPCKPKTG